MDISNILKLRRLELRISQSDLANHLGLKHKSSIHYLETGKSEWKFNQVIEACQFLKLNLTIRKR